MTLRLCHFAITRYESIGATRYDGLQIGFNSRRNGGGWYEFQGSYTLSWAKGHTNANRFGSVNNPFNVDDEYAYLTTDQRHRFIVNGTAHLPWDFQLASIFFAGSKKPLDITTIGDPLRIGIGSRWLDATRRRTAEERRANA